MLDNKSMPEQKENRLYLSAKRIITIFIVMFVIFEAIFYFSFQGKDFYPFHFSFYIYTPFLIFLSVLFCYMSIKQTYYVIEKKRIIHVKMGKAFQYYFSEIIYVDEKWSEKHKTVLFYQKDGHSRFLAFDKNGEIYQTILERSPLLSREEFQQRFPNVKL